jgi:hypothetical protein
MLALIMSDWVYVIFHPHCYCNHSTLITSSSYSGLHAMEHKNHQQQQQQLVSPNIRLNGALPVQCPNEEMKHGWTFACKCPCCSTLIYLCCCLPEDDTNLNVCCDNKSFGYGCGDYMVAASPAYQRVLNFISIHGCV